MPLNIAIDFDGTIVDHAYPEIGKDNPGAIVCIKTLQNKGCNIMLFTMRSGIELDQAVDYCTRNGINLWGVNKNPEQNSWTDSPKVYANIYIDDAALGAPLSMYLGFNRQAVNWLDVAGYFAKNYPEIMDYDSLLKIVEQYHNQKI